MLCAKGTAAAFNKKTPQRCQGSAQTDVEDVTARLHAKGVWKTVESTMKKLMGLVLGCGCLAGFAVAEPTPELHPFTKSKFDRVAVGESAIVTHAESRQSLTASQMDAVTAGVTGEVVANDALSLGTFNNPIRRSSLLGSRSLSLRSFGPRGCLFGCDQQSASSSASSAQDGAGYVPPQFPGTTPTPTPPQLP